MKTKFKILLVTCVIAAVAITGFNFGQNGSNIDVSLADIAVMAKADGEVNPDCPNGCLAECGEGCYCYEWYDFVKEAEWP